MFVTAHTQQRRDLCSLMAVHIGQELRTRFDASGMTVKAFAARVGRSPKNIYELFERPSIDTQVLRKACEALRFNFFTLFAQDMEQEFGMSGTMASEPSAVYGRRPTGGRSPLRVVIEVDPADEGAQQAALKMAEQMRAAPAPDRDKGSS